MTAVADSPRELDELTTARAQRGDRAAQLALIRMYQPLVFRIVSRVLVRRDAGAVEDAAQETFLAVLGALPRFKITGAARLSTWVATIAVRRALDLTRQREFAELPIQLAADGRGDVAFAARDTVRAIERALANLAPEYRAAFVLREYEGYEYAEIATAPGINVGTVKSRLSRARAELRSQLKEFR